MTTTPGTFLDRIVEATRHRLAAQRAAIPLDTQRARAQAAPPARDFAGALRPARFGSARLIAEIKRASPSKGLLANDFDPVARARAFESGGAAAISVLTEPEFFLGSLAHLSAVREAVSLPILRKDFVLDPYQLYEARAAGADAVLLICALLDDAELRQLLDLARSLGMEALVEAHDADEARRAVAVGARVIGVNSRDLRTFFMDPDIVARLRPLVPEDRIFAAESGIADADGAVRARASGADAILVGEALMRPDDPHPLTHVLARAGGGSAAALFARHLQPIVKLCGLREPGHAVIAVEEEADAIGLIFAPARRQVTVEQARAIVVAARAAAARLGTRAPFAVGVFVDAAPEAIRATVGNALLDAIQLSGSETPELCATLLDQTVLPVIKALRPAGATDLALLAEYSAAGAALLIEPAHLDGPGGQGHTGDWALARKIAARWPVLLAGGLTPDNVGDAMRTVKPRGVDVSSGTETDGTKDPAKLRAFVRAARQAVISSAAADGARSEYGT